MINAEERIMKRPSILSLVLALGLILTHVAWAAEPYSEKPEAWEVVGDILWLRPLGFIGTVFSASAYVVSLPVLAFDRKAEQTMDSVVKDYQYFTFERPLGGQ
jgi:hypothetical protein